MTAFYGSLPATGPLFDLLTLSPCCVPGVTKAIALVEGMASSIPPSPEGPADPPATGSRDPCSSPRVTSQPGPSGPGPCASQQHGAQTLISRAMGPVSRPHPEPGSQERKPRGVWPSPCPCLSAPGRQAGPSLWSESFWAWVLWGHFTDGVTASERARRCPSSQGPF